MEDGMNDEDKFSEIIERDEAESEQLGNPAPPPDVDMDLLRGDRIGDTVYSGKWCIQTVMKLLQSNVVAKPNEGEDKTEMVDMEENLQNEVGVLWDMTINVEVCQYLQSVGAIESIYHVIANSRCPRATEMCVGMLANIVSHEELWQSLHSDETLFTILIPLLGESDQPLLLELSRFFNTALNHQNHQCCYGSIWENRNLVSQELVRILSGSTNSDLLSQTAELTHLLMYLDHDDSHFNALFADVDFIASILEASKEFGFHQATTGQARVMDILHCLTTFEAGITAIEPCMEEMTRAAVSYLTMLCHSLNLSGSCDVITVIIRILNHIFCRSLTVRIQLMSSSSIMHCMLKILVSAYRRLGLYNSLASNPNNKTLKNDDTGGKENQLNREPSTTSSPFWETQSTEERKKGRQSEASWSERAGAGDGSGSAIRTPDASPQQPQRLKELELSWSERRIASPLDGKAGSKVEGEREWKRPAERKKKLKRKTGRKEMSKVELCSKEEEKGDEDEEEGGEDESGKDCSSNEEGLSVITNQMGEDKSEEESKSDKTSHNSSSQFQDQSNVLRSSVNRRVSSTDSSVSEGFEPSLEMPNDLPDDDDMDFERKISQSKDIELTEPVKARSGSFQTENHSLDMSANMDTEGEGSEEKNVNNEKCLNHHFNIEDEESREASFLGTDRYQSLLDVLTEFLTDFFNNIRESLTTEQGIPVLAETVTFLDSQCSSSYIHALVQCLSLHDGSLSKPLDRLLHLASHLKAKHLHRVLSQSLPQPPAEDTKVS